VFGCNRIRFKSLLSKAQDLVAPTNFYKQTKFQIFKKNGTKQTRRVYTTTIY